MKTKDGFIQGYNAQAAVDATAQVVVAHGLDVKQSVALRFEGRKRVNADQIMADRHGPAGPDGKGCARTRCRQDAIGTPRRAPYSRDILAN